MLMINSNNAIITFLTIIHDVFNITVTITMITDFKAELAGADAKQMSEAPH